MRSRPVISCAAGCLIPFFARSSVRYHRNVSYACAQLREHASQFSPSEFECGCLRPNGTEARGAPLNLRTESASWTWEGSQPMRSPCDAPSVLHFLFCPISGETQANPINKLCCARPTPLAATVTSAALAFGLPWERFSHSTNSPSERRVDSDSTPPCWGCQVTNPISCILHLISWNQESKHKGIGGRRTILALLLPASGNPLVEKANCRSEGEANSRRVAWLDHASKATLRTLCPCLRACNARCWCTSVEGCGLGGKGRRNCRTGRGFELGPKRGHRLT